MPDESRAPRVKPWRHPAVRLAGTVVVLILLFTVLPAGEMLSAMRRLPLSAWLLAIGTYLARKGFGNTYGAAGSIVAVLAWVYFSSTLVFVGAELTQEWARHRGRALVPDRHAVHVPRRHPDQHAPPP